MDTVVSKARCDVQTQLERAAGDVARIAQARQGEQAELLVVLAWALVLDGFWGLTWG